MKYDIEKHTRRLFPWFWQNPTNMSLIDTVLTVFNEVNSDYDDAETLYTAKVGYSVQRKSLEDALNSQFDSIQNRITVVNGVNAGANFVFNEAEVIVSDLEMFVFNEAESVTTPPGEAYVFNEAEATGSASSPFTVTAPLTLSSQENEIRAWIEFVQITGTEYELVFI